MDMIISSLSGDFDYFGACYYDSDLSVWLSVDRYTEKYPSLSPYQYVSLNPINFIDINGDSINISFLSVENRKKLIGELS